MVLAAYVAGLITTPAAVLGVLAGSWWWARYRRAQGGTAGVMLTPLPPLPPPQGVPVLNAISLRSVPGNRRRSVRGRR